MSDVSDAFDRIGSAGRYRIVFTAQTGRGRRRNLATVVGGPGLWYPADSVHRFDKALRHHDPGVAAATVASAAYDDAYRFATGAALRDQIPWPVVSMVCDVVHAADRHSVDVDVLKVVVERYGPYILKLAELAPEEREHAQTQLQAAIRNAVVVD